MKPLAAVGLGSLLICIGCGVAQTSDGPQLSNSKPKSVHESAEEQKYREAFIGISGKFEAIQRPTQGSDPEAFLAALKENHEKEREIISELSDLKPPQKFKEFHETMVQWKKERWALDEEGIGFLTNKEMEKVDELSSRIDDVGATYTQKIDEIVKAHGYTSTEKFLGIQ